MWDSRDLSNQLHRKINKLITLTPPLFLSASPHHLKNADSPSPPILCSLSCRRYHCRRSLQSQNSLSQLVSSSSSLFKVLSWIFKKKISQICVLFVLFPICSKTSNSIQKCQQKICSRNAWERMRSRERGLGLYLAPRFRSPNTVIATVTTGDGSSISLFLLCGHCWRSCDGFVVVRKKDMIDLWWGLKILLSIEIGLDFFFFLELHGLDLVVVVMWRRREKEKGLEEDEERETNTGVGERKRGRRGKREKG